MTTGLIAPRKPAPAWLTDIDTRSLFIPFGSLDELKGAINDGGVKLFGSGWSWLVWDGTALAVYSTPNQDSLLMQDDVPLLGVDVWEHAYYLSYQNRRPDYLSAGWNVVNWDEVGKRYDEARAS